MWDGLIKVFLEDGEGDVAIVRIDTPAGVIRSPGLFSGMGPFCTSTRHT
jgi:hypothetical protein